MPSPASIEYMPNAVPERDDRNHSYRDDVRRTIFRHKFRPSRTHFSRLSDIYSFFLTDNNYTTDSPLLQEKFRSALGRVLRPPSTADSFALSFAVPFLTKYRGYISIVSPDCPSVLLADEIRQRKLENGRRRREAAQDCKEISRLRQSRLDKKLNAPTDVPEQPPQKLSFRYVDELISLNCAEDLLKLKELAESMSAYAAVREHLQVTEFRGQGSEPGVSVSDKTVTLVAVGDGVTPRTGAMFAFRTQWNCLSIDPSLRSGPWHDVANLRTIPQRVQDATVTVSSPLERVVIIMWHAHVSVRDAVGCLQIDGRKWDTDDVELSRKLRHRVAVVSCFCCNFDEMQRAMPDGSAPDIEYEDTGIPGLMRTVRIWKFTSVTPNGVEGGMEVE